MSSVRPPFEGEHWIRVHRPFTHPKQWVRHVPGQGYGFTTDFDKRCMLSREDALWVMGSFRRSFPEDFVVTMDGI